MKRDIRKIEREISSEEANDILLKGEYGVLATISDEGYPYALPLSYVFADDVIYIHGAKEGHKLDNINFSSKVSFCVVGDTKVLSEKFSTNYESAIVFGKAVIIEGEEKTHALTHLIKKYSPDFMVSGLKYIENDQHRTTAFKIEIEKISGKARR